MDTSRTDGLSDDERAALYARVRERYESWVRDHRLRPAQRVGQARLTVICGGRGAGKTLAGASWLARMLTEAPPAEWAIIAPTFAAARNVCMEGPAGLLAVLGLEGKDRSDAYNRSSHELHYRGHVVWLDSLDEGAERVQGKNLAGAWVDEASLGRPADVVKAWDVSLLPAVRIGRAQLVVTMTPKPTPLARRLLKDPEADVRRMSTWENAENLSPVAVEDLRRRYEGTRLGRQELEGILIEDVEGALFSQAWIDDQRVSELGAWLQRTVVGVDPAEGSGGSEQAYTVCALGGDHQLYVLESVGMRESVATFARRCIEATARHSAEMVVEKNHGGAWLREVLESECRSMGVVVPIRMVTSSVGKRVRAEPVAALFEQRRVSVVGVQDALEAQLTSFTGPGDPSDLLDSMVFSLADLSAGGFGPSAGGEALPWNEGGSVAGGAIAWS